jgi:hypothetical protein
MGDIISIIEGHTNLALKKVGIEFNEVEQLAVLRERVCRDQCTENNGTTYLYTDEKEKERCAACNCVMEAKWRSVSAFCPFRKW